MHIRVKLIISLLNTLYNVIIIAVDAKLIFIGEFKIGIFIALLNYSSYLHHPCLISHQLMNN